MISEDLLKMLVCPKCKGDIKLDRLKSGLVCNKCRLIYEIKNGIPIMIVEKAAKLQAIDKTD